MAEDAGAGVGLADGTGHWEEVWQNLERGARNQPEWAILGALFFLGLLNYRRLLIQRLAKGWTPSAMFAAIALDSPAAPW